MKLWLIEIILGFCILISITVVGFIFMHSTWQRYQFNKTSYQTQFSTFQEKEIAKKQDNATKKLLQQWHDKNPVFYEAVIKSPTSDQLLLLLTNTIQRAGFKVIQAQSLHFILSGHYANLFYLIDAVNQLPWPITLQSLSISTVTQFDIQFIRSA